VLAGYRVARDGGGVADYLHQLAAARGLASSPLAGVSGNQHLEHVESIEWVVGSRDSGGRLWPASLYRRLDLLRSLSLEQAAAGQVVRNGC